MNRRHLPQNIAFIVSILLGLAFSSCEEEEENGETGCLECQERQFVDSLINAEMSLRRNEHNQFDAMIHDPLDFLWVTAYKLCAPFSDDSVTTNDIFTISGALYTACDSSTQYLSISKYERTGKYRQECTSPDGTSSSLPNLSCQVSDSVRNKYSNGAIGMACQYRKEDPDYLIDSTSSETALSALSAIFTSDLSEAQMIYHEFGGFSHHYCPDHVCMSVFTTEEWTQKLINGDSITGNASFDSLIAVTHMSIDSRGEYIELGTQDLLVNTDSLASLIGSMDGVEYAESCSPLIGSGSSMTMDSYEEGVLISFRVGYGDCLSGCIYGTYWNFMVYDDCSVEFLEQCGDLRPSYDEIYF